MKVSRAMLAGVFGAAAMSIAMTVLRFLGYDINLEGMLGSVFQDHLPIWVAGFAVHVGIGVMVALMYAAAFEYGVQESGALIGAGLGLSHAMFAGLFMSAIPAMNPLDGGMHSGPGAFFSHVQFGPVWFFLLHVLFGLVVGIVYGQPLQKPHLLTRRVV